MEQSCSAVGRSNDEQKQGQLETHKKWCYTGVPNKKEKQILSHGLGIYPLNKLITIEYFLFFALTLKQN